MGEGFLIVFRPRRGGATTGEGRGFDARGRGSTRGGGVRSDERSEEEEGRAEGSFLFLMERPVRPNLDHSSARSPASVFSRLSGNFPRISPSRSDPGRQCTHKPGTFSLFSLPSSLSLSAHQHRVEVFSLEVCLSLVMFSLSLVLSSVMFPLRMKFFDFCPRGRMRD